MPLYRVKVYRELAGWVYVYADTRGNAISNAALGNDEISEEREVSFRVGGEVEEVEE